MKNKEPKYYFDNQLKPPKAFFEWCYYSMPTYEWSNKNETIIGSERKHCYVTKKRLAKNSNLTFFDKKKTFAIILSTSKRIEVQTYIVSSRFVEGKQHLDHRLVNLEHFSADKHIKVSNDCSIYKFGLVSTTGMFNYDWPDLYPNEWRDRLSKNSELKYLNLWHFSSDDIKTIYKYRKEIEFAQRIKASKVAKDIGEHRAGIDMRIVTKNWLKKHKQFLSNSSRGLEEVRLKEAIEERGGKMVLGVEKYLSVSDLHLIPKEIGIVKFQNYLIKQKTSFSYYEDYISMLEDLKAPLTKSTLLPKSIHEAHDKAVETLNAIKREVVRTGYKERAKSLSEIETTVGNYSFIIPKTADDLVKEGQVLHHCVGGSQYIDGHAEGKTTIIFIRKKEALTDPFYTLEFKSKHIVQIRGKYNEDATPEVQKAADQWLNQVTNKQKTMRNTNTFQEVG